MVSPHVKMLALYRFCKSTLVSSILSCNVSTHLHKQGWGGRISSIASPQRLQTYKEPKKILRPGSIKGSNSAAYPTSNKKKSPSDLRRDRQRCHRSQEPVTTPPGRQGQCQRSRITRSQCQRLLGTGSQLVSTPPGHQEPASTPLGHQEPVLTSHGHQEPLSTPLDHQEPKSMPLVHQ